MKISKRFALAPIALILFSVVVSGCAPALIAGGAVGGYAIAKNTEDHSSSVK